MSSLLYKTPLTLVIRPPLTLSLLCFLPWSNFTRQHSYNPLILISNFFISFFLSCLANDTSLSESNTLSLSPCGSKRRATSPAFSFTPTAVSSDLSADHPSFFNTTSQDQRVVKTKKEESKPYDHKVNKFMTHEGSSDRRQASSLQSAVDIHNAANGHILSFSRKQDGDYESASDNTGSSVMRLMKKMMNSNCRSGSTDYYNKQVNEFRYPMHDSDETNSFSKTNNSIRVCSDCKTTTTPLWRSGPRGPKSLCNACGIRQRKARRTMEAAAAYGAAIATDATSTKIKVQYNKEKKSRTSHVAQYRKQFKVSSGYNSPHHYHQSQKKLCFKEFALSLSKNTALQRVFPQDVKDAAILLMELSYGLVHS